ncbi:hypothetical protein FKM82_025293 [Ascaphus truei]
MSFSATILFSPPPGQNEGKCGCKSETTQEGPPLAEGVTPITVSGQGVAVQGCEQLLHLIYQRVEKAVGLAESALGVAKANSNLLNHLQEEIIDDYLSPECPVPRILAPNFVKQLAVSRPHGDTVEILSESAPPLLKNTHNHLLIQKDGSLSPGGMLMAEATPGAAEMRLSASPPPLALFYTGSTSQQHGNGQKCSRRKRDLVLSKLVHNLHNHISNNKRFNGSESIKSSWNISVLRFLVEKLKQELVSNIQHYTDKELKGACVAYFLTKRREYRNSMNPFKSLREKEEKKLRSRRYRLFANRSWGVQQFPVEEQTLWEGVTEELMSDEEDSLSEPGVWVARPPRFRAPELSRLCYRIDSHSKHGNKANRIYGALSDRLPSAETRILPQHLYNTDWEREDDDDEEGELDGVERGSKAYCPDLNSFIEIKVEKDE